MSDDESRVAIEELAETEGTLQHLAAYPTGPATSILVLVHGRSRRARALIEAFAAAGTQRGAVVVAPVFSRARYEGYQRLGGAAGPLAAADALQRTLDQVQELWAAGDGTTLPVDLLGFSAGAQFAHRYAMTRPEAVRTLVVAAAGWYTMPDASIAFPHGLAPGDALHDPVRLDDFLRLPIRVMVGEDDVSRDAHLNASPALDETQGHHRLERARRWVQAMQNAAAADGVHSSITLELLPRTGHSASEAITRGGLVRRVLRFIDSCHHDG